MDIFTELPNIEFGFTEKYSVIIEALRKASITTSEVVLSTPENLSLKINRPLDEVSRFYTELGDQLKQSISVPKNTLSETKSRLTSYTTGDDKIDTIFQASNGIPLGYLVEISGGSATGKSHFLMNLAITAQFPMEFNGLGSSIFDESYEQPKVMYLATESRLETHRLTQIIDHYEKLIFEPNGVPQKYRPCLENLITASYVISDLEYQDHVLMVQVPQMLERTPSLKVIIIDSITHHIRAELTDYKSREACILKTVTFLKKLAIDHNISIVVANQVSDKPVGEIIGKDMDYFMSLDYQMSWCYGWDLKGTIYRQTYDKHREEEEWDTLNDNYYKNLNPEPMQLATTREVSSLSSSGSPTSTPQPVNESNKLSLSEQVKLEKKQQLFESRLRNSFNRVKTVPALGLNWTNFVDIRIFLTRTYKPILDEKMIEEFQVDLGIDTSIIKSLEADESSDLSQAQDKNLANETAMLTQEGNTSSLSKHDSQINNNTNNQLPSAPLSASMNEGTSKSGVSELLASNDYLANRNFEAERYVRLVYSPFTTSTNENEVTKRFEIWNGGIRSC